MFVVIVVEVCCKCNFCCSLQVQIFMAPDLSAKKPIRKVYFGDDNHCDCDVDSDADVERVRKAVSTSFNQLQAEHKSLCRFVVVAC